MGGFSELFRMVVPAIVIPVGVFVANWSYRTKRGYAQTAASDFILAVLIFDGGVVAAADEFEPFVRTPALRGLLVDWHISVAIAGGFLWLAVLKWGEPVVAKYYETQSGDRRKFPAIRFLLCWMSVLILVATHVAFFVING